MDFEQLIQKQRAFSKTKECIDYENRLQRLYKLKQAIQINEKQIQKALYEDLNKSEMEGYMSEIGMVYEELNVAIKNLKKWMKPKRIATPLAQFHATSKIYKDPMGVVLVMAPWNYPFQLSIVPLVSSIAAGNTTIIKPSAYAKATSTIIYELLTSTFKEEEVAVIEGGREENAALLEGHFDFIFFTGGLTVGKIVMEKASRYLTPIVLELGGKSPCIVDKSANLELAAKRIVFGKSLNSGQTCVAPDYCIVDASIKDQLVELMIKQIKLMLSEQPLTNLDYPKIINAKHHQRLVDLIQNSSVLHGGHYSSTKIEPTIVDATFDSLVMQEEIFGPILPIISFQNFKDMVAELQTLPHPLALYLFTCDSENEKLVLNQLRYGGGCINDTIIHLATTKMGFGGVGESGMGSYHGEIGFNTFSHQKSIVKKSNWMDLPFRYHPYTEKKFKMIRKFMK